MFLKNLQFKNLLSFGPESEPVELGPLNVLIGPNGSGKSNFLEGLALLKALPGKDFASILSRGGGIREWMWKGGDGVLPMIMAEVDWAPNRPVGLEGQYRQLLEKGGVFQSNTLAYFLQFTTKNDHFFIYFESISDRTDTKSFFYRYQEGLEDTKNPLLQAADGSELVPGDDFNPRASILSQRRDPERFPQVTYLGDTFPKFRLYRSFPFGPMSVLRDSVRVDLRSDFLEEDLSNLPLVLSTFRRQPEVKTAVLSSLQALFEGVTDFEVVAEGGRVRLFLQEGKVSIPAERLSDGTLRYLCLLAILCHPNPPPVIAIEEPELGLHPDILPRLADLLRKTSERTQIILTTHSDLLVDALTDVPNTVITCEKVQGSTVMSRLDSERLKSWLKRYTLGELWLKGELGGTRW